MRNSYTKKCRICLNHPVLLTKHHFVNDVDIAYWSVIKRYSKHVNNTLCTTLTGFYSNAFSHVYTGTFHDNISLMMNFLIHLPIYNEVSTCNFIIYDDKLSQILERGPYVPPHNVYKKHFITLFWPFQLKNGRNGNINKIVCYMYMRGIHMELLPKSLLYFSYKKLSLHPVILSFLRTFLVYSFAPQIITEYPIGFSWHFMHQQQYDLK